MKKVLKAIYKQYLKKTYNCGGGGVTLLANKFYDDYRQRKVSFIKILRIHRKGFSVEDWCVMALNSKICDSYISTAQYYGMHPLNGQYSKWIDDKLTLKYICAGTILDEYMPEYYYLIDSFGVVHHLMDVPHGKANNIIEFLCLKNTLALKRVSGSLGEGFYCLEFKNEKYYVNGTCFNYVALSDFINSLRDYIITEYLRPHADISKLSSGTVNCIRYLVGRVDGKMKLLKSFVRFGTKESGFVENYSAGGVLCYINEEGYFSGGNMIRNNRNIEITTHPDNGYALTGTIPLWSQITEAVNKFDQFFPQLNYLGFDIAVTNENKVKILEINSLTSLDTLQLKESLLQTDNKDFYMQYLK